MTKKNLLSPRCLTLFILLISLAASCSAKHSESYPALQPTMELGQNASQATDMQRHLAAKSTTTISKVSPASNSEFYKKGKNQRLFVTASNPSAVKQVKFIVFLEGEKRKIYTVKNVWRSNMFSTVVTKLPLGNHKWRWEVVTKDKKKIRSDGWMYFSVLVHTDPPTSSPTNKPVGDFSTKATPTPEITIGLQADCYVHDSSKFNICLDIQSSSGKVEYWMEAFGIAKQRWEEVIVGDSNPSVTNLAQYWSNKNLIATSLPPVTDDIYISAWTKTYDGKGGVLGMATPYLMDSDTKRPVGGWMMFDSADVSTLYSRGMWTNTILHEIGHVLGLGSMWSHHGLHPGSGYIFNDKYKTNSEAQRVWEEDFCPGGRLPIETANFGEGIGYGTAAVHFDEQCVQDELMTGIVDKEMPLSKLTLASLADMGYIVDYDKADHYGREDLGECKAAYCPGLSRNLRTRKSSQSSQKRRQLSANGRELALKAAATEMHKIRSLSPSSLPPGVEVNAGEFMTVYIEDEDGHVKEETVSWDDAKQFAPDGHE